PAAPAFGPTRTWPPCAGTPLSRISWPNWIWKASDGPPRTSVKVLEEYIKLARWSAAAPLAGSRKPSLLCNSNSTRISEARTSPLPDWLQAAAVLRAGIDQGRQSLTPARL